MKKKKHIMLIQFVIITIIFCHSVYAANLPPPGIVPSPTDGEVIKEAKPTIFINYTKSKLDRETFRLFINDKEIPTEKINITENNASFTFEEKQQEGVYKVRIQYDFPFEDSNTVTYTWNFKLEPPIDFNEIIQMMVIGLMIFCIIFVIIILYLKKQRNFSFKKFFIRHPIKKKVFFIYIPFFISFIIGVLLLSYATGTPEEELDPFIYQYILIIVTIIAITPFGIVSQLDKKKMKRYEIAFSQFLFEVSDAMRGGLDPAKAIIEISKTETSILSKHLKRAADNIKLGRPFDEVMIALAKPIDSILIRRYSSIIGETSKIGGEPATVIHRAAKDMDDFIKINDERRRELSTQITIIYIGFIVLAIVVYLLISMFPELQGIDVGALMGGSFSKETASAVKESTKMSLITFKQRFFDLLIVDSICTGTIIGSFVEGNIKYGFIHSLILITSTLVFFLLLII